MQIKCEYCGSMIDDHEGKCPNCGAANLNIKRTTDHTPKTIEELKQWYQDRNLPPYETTRFFIGINYPNPRAFGIYEENGEFIVYKNKDTGERAIRYQGTDEAYAVNELYLKLKSEILNQKSLNSKREIVPEANKVPEANNLQKLVATLFLSLFCIIPTFGFAIALHFGINDRAGLILMGMFAGFWFATVLTYGLEKGICKRHQKKHPDEKAVFWKNPFAWIACRPVKMHWLSRFAIIFLAIVLLKWNNYDTHYYKYDNHYYAEYNHDWYEYSDNDYSHIGYDALPIQIQTNPVDFEYNWNQDTADWYMTSFEDSKYYEDHFESSGSGDSSYDWDSGSDWDSGGTDWGSDW